MHTCLSKDFELPGRRLKAVLSISHRRILQLSLFLLLTPLLALANDLDPAAALERIRHSQLELDKAVAVENIRLETGMAVLEMARGTVIPTQAPGHHAIEMVFLGEGSLNLDGPDAVEAGQLDLFTGSTSLHERIEAGVFVVAMDAAAEALLHRERIPDLDPTVAGRAAELLTRWRQSPERRLLDIEGAMLADALEDPLYEGYFAGWFQGAELGTFLYVVEPSAPEQVTLGQFVQLEASEREKTKNSPRATQTAAPGPADRPGRGGPGHLGYLGIRQPAQ